jgi:energy-coupling factor transport system substrate-specific component
MLDVLLLGGALVLLLSDRRLTVSSGTVLLSLVAATAAARVAMADLPNVQPVSVMVLLAGATMGARRGVAFAVLVTILSNTVLGDGLWTLLQAVGC